LGALQEFYERASAIPQAGMHVVLQKLDHSARDFVLWGGLTGIDTGAQASTLG
jgi:hypothetical protein